MTQSDFRRSELRTRIVTGILLAAVAIACVWLGGVVFAGLIAAAAVLVLREWRGLTRLKPFAYRLSLALLAGALALVLIDPRVDGLWKATALLAGGSVGLALISGPAAFGLAYAGIPAVALIWLRALPLGFELLVWVLAVVIATDVFAYFTGRLIGGRKLAPKISPGKTWSGLLGGVIAALVVGWIVADHFMLSQWLAPWLGLCGGLMAVLAQGGDLFESWLKRRAGAKDSGKLLPGHGGVMDRVDGLLPVAIATTVIIVVGMGLG